MQSQNVRPISTYDNLTTTTASTAKPKMKQQQQQQQPLWSGESPGQVRDDPSIAINGNKKTWPANSQDRQQPAVAKQVLELNDTSHSIAAVKAALSDAKSKFFGIHRCETLDATASPAGVRDSPAAAMPSVVIKPEPKYQNVPQPTRIPALPEASSSPTVVSKRFGGTYEQIPLSDLDALQPTQAVYMSTTVPQNMKGMNIAGRHTPTRNSLRHSRMIVVNNKNHDSIQETYTSHFRNSNFSRQLLILQLAVGLLIVGLAISILIWTPSASILINPYLSGLSLLLASIAGLILLGRDRGSDYKRADNNCYKVLLVESYVFSALALIFCCLALVCTAIEFAELQTTSTLTDGNCGPATSSLLNYSNCTCLTEEHQATTTAALSDAGSDDIDNGDTCEAIRGKWKYFLGFSMALNALGIFATFLYITIFICCYHSRQHFNISV